MLEIPELGDSSISDIGKLTVREWGEQTFEEFGHNKGHRAESDTIKGTERSS